MSENVKTLSDADFKEVISGKSTPILVDFYADWCGPCKMIAPVLEEVAGEFKDKVEIFKVNVDVSRNIPGEFSVSSIPTLIMLKDGAEVERFVGYKSKKELQDILNRYSVAGN
jgi:thioredoxin 1